MKRVALVGNPNSGKTSLFNALTGLRQKTGNYPGITVEKIEGTMTLEPGNDCILQDLPGAYSLHPTSFEEKVVCQVLANPTHPDHPDLIVYVLDIQHIEKQMLLFTQVMELGLPVILALNMSDQKDRQYYHYDHEQMAARLSLPVIEISSRTGSNLDQLRQSIADQLENKEPVNFDPWTGLPDLKDLPAGSLFSDATSYQKFLMAVHWALFKESVNSQFGIDVEAWKVQQDDVVKLQVDDTLSRFDAIHDKKLFEEREIEIEGWSERIDPIVTHPLAGPLIFMVIMLMVFQAIYTWAALPMDWIEQIFDYSSTSLSGFLSEGWWSSLLLDGVIPGIAGVLVFVPQIALLFLLITILEETGYMARVAYLLDSLMQRFGMSGRSVVALISGGACAIPAIMSTRSISSPKERLITILVVPFIGCSARLPIYTIIIGFAVPSAMIFGFIDSRALLFLGLYLLGALAALFAGWVLKYLLKAPTDSSAFIIEMPEYKVPDFRTVLINVYKKTEAFVIEAGKIIFVISILLWVLAAHGPGHSQEKAVEKVVAEAEMQNWAEEKKERMVQSANLRASYIGRLGQWIEPVIRPLGFDWKIGIGLLSSFAAREVFVGTMATIYSIGDEESGFELRDKMRKETFPDSGEKVYSYATAMSLLIFYVLALQCMSTL
ncbi:MAG TPA: ferrous iron transport protein B, partial [Saprospiraceae bacterium]|nr:ferrous iron transport protein B [Saprospiraceae bacterium]